MFPSVERRSVLPSPSQKQLGPPACFITEIVGHELVGGEVVWKVHIMNNVDLIVVSEEQREWLYQSPNCELVADFIQRHVPLNSPALRKPYERLISGEPVALVPEPEAIAGAEGDSSQTQAPLFLSDSEDEPDDLPVEFLDEFGGANFADSEPAPPSPGGDSDGFGLVYGADFADNDSQESEDGKDLDEIQGYSQGEDDDAEEEDQLANDPSGNEDTTLYEIEGIVDYSESQEDGQLWLVRWKGYKSRDDQWLGTDSFSTAQELFDMYNGHHGITVWGRGHKHSADEDSEHELEEGSGCDSPKPEGLIESSLTFKACTLLLSSSAIEQEIKSLHAGATPSSSIRLFNLSAILTQIGELNITNMWISSYLQYDSHRNNSSLTRIACLQEGVQLTSPLLHGLDQVAILRKALKWEIAQVLLIVYEWLTDTAPALVDALLLPHAWGISMLNQDFPNFALLMDHVVGSSGLDPLHSNLGDFL
ncbi:hypothetical protein B0H10DRAFT_1943098 [Mycena sp. CBHHK59/15]|nr:hypothetical protein B0H10DRAFT_1943098 [Mycena sp. CBHHK59/15]